MLNLGKKNNVILGYPWLMKNNLKIDWTTGEVHMMGTFIPKHNEPEIIEQWYLLWYLGAVDNGERIAAKVHERQRNTATLRWVLGEDHPHIWKLTLSTALTQAVEKVEQKLSPQYAKYTKVFHEPGEGELPPDNLSTTPSISKKHLSQRWPKPTWWTPKRWRHVKSSLMKISKSAKFTNPNLHKPCCFSLYRRKTEDSILVRTTDISMNILSKMLTHFPSSPPSSTNWKEPSTSPRWIFDGGTITFASKKEMNGKWHLSHLTASMNHW